MCVSQGQTGASERQVETGEHQASGPHMSLPGPGRRGRKVRHGNQILLHPAHVSLLPPGPADAHSSLSRNMTGCFRDQENIATHSLFTLYAMQAIPASLNLIFKHENGWH